jgi:hypothetical protein
MASDKEVQDVILSGLVFRKAPAAKPSGSNKVKTKAKKKSYITGLHGSGAARKKAQIRERRANRHKK